MHHPTFETVLSPLDRVIAVGRTVESGGIAVELISVEIRKAGALISWRAKPIGDLLLLDADVRVSGGDATAYTSLAAGHEGSSLQWSGQSFFAPSPPVGTRLTISILSFGPPIDHEVPRGLSRQHIHGPWQFTVDT